MIQLADRADMIGTIEALYPPDSKYNETAERGREFMDNLIGNKVGYMNWRSLPNCDLLKLATAMLEEDSVEEPAATTESKYMQYAGRGQRILIEEPSAITKYPEFSAGWWFQKLPEPYRGKAIANITSDGVFKSISVAIIDSFNWGATKQGGGYWGKLYTRARKGEFDGNNDLVTNRPIQDQFEREYSDGDLLLDQMHADAPSPYDP